MTIKLGHIHIFRMDGICKKVAMRIAKRIQRTPPTRQVWWQ